MSIGTTTPISYDYDTYDTDNSDYDSADEYDSDTDDVIEENLLYDFDYLPRTRFSMGLCELYNDKIHGPTDNDAVNSGFLLLCRFKELQFKPIRRYTQRVVRLVHRAPRHLFKHHNMIRNYPVLYSRIKPEILECHYLDKDDIMCVKKTIWIRLIQRTWKNIFKKRQQILKQRYTISSLRYKEINGHWPIHCVNLPSIHGMLNRLVN